VSLVDISPIWAPMIAAEVRRLYTCVQCRLYAKIMFYIGCIQRFLIFNSRRWVMLCLCLETRASSLEWTQLSRLSPDDGDRIKYSKRCFKQGQDQCPETVVYLLVYVLPWRGAATEDKPVHWTRALCSVRTEGLRRWCMTLRIIGVLNFVPCPGLKKTRTRRFGYWLFPSFSLRLKTETDPVSETSCSSIFLIPDVGQSLEPLQFSV
jgi:hypothetical protein